MITTLQVKTKLSSRRVHFQEINSLEKEEERSRRGQLNRKIVKELKKEWAKMSSNPDAVVYSEEQHERMKHAFECLKFREDTIVRGYECPSSSEFRELVGNLDESTLNDVAFHFYK